MDSASLAAIDEDLKAFMGPYPRSAFPGATLAVVKDGLLVKETAYGYAQTHAGEQKLERFIPMRAHTLFDLASITKVFATAPAVMRLVDQGVLNLDEPIRRWVPEFTSGGKQHVTLRLLLTHRAGLWEWQPTYLHARAWDEVIDYITQLDLRYPVNEVRQYSDLGFMLTSEVVRRVTGNAFDRYVRRELYRPMNLHNTGYTPVLHTPRRVAATSYGNPYEYRMIKTRDPYPILPYPAEGDPEDLADWRHRTLIGEVNDGNSFYGFGGVAGHAGLFSPARELAAYGNVLAHRGTHRRRRIFSESIVAEFTSDQYDRGQGLGFWTHRLADISEAGNGGFGHAGFTGTNFVVEADKRLVVVLLTNRNHPDELQIESVDRAWEAVLRRVVESLSAK